MSKETKSALFEMSLSLRVLTFVLVALSLAVYVSCGGGGGGNGGSSSPPTITSVSVSCNPLSVQTGQTSKCAATVSGTGNYDPSVTWSVDNGTIDQSGNYTAPATAATATVKATSKQDATKSGTASVTVIGQVKVFVTPSSVQVQVFHSQQFLATVSGSSNTNVAWAVNRVQGGNLTVGQIDSGGYYVAPNVVPSPSAVTVTATSQADTTQTASASLTVLPDANPPAIVSVTPAADQDGVSLDSSIRIQFSDALDPSTVNSSTFTLSSGSTTLTSSVGFDPASNTVTITPSGVFAPGSQYTVTVSNQVADPAGTPLAAASQWSFTTQTVTSANGTVSAVSGVDPTTLTVVSYGGQENTPDSQGNFTASLTPLGTNLVAAMVPGKSFGWLTFAGDQSQGSNPAATEPLRRMLSQRAVLPGKPSVHITRYQITASPKAALSSDVITIDSQTTAESLLFMTPYLHRSDPARAAVIQAAIAADPNTTLLAQALVAAQGEADPIDDSAVQHDLLTAIVSVTNSLNGSISQQSFAKRRNNRPTSEASQAISPSTSALSSASSSAFVATTTPNCWPWSSSHISTVADGQLPCLDLDYVNLTASPQPQNGNYTVGLQDDFCPGNTGQVPFGLYTGCDVDWLAFTAPINSGNIPEGGIDAILPDDGSKGPSSPEGDMLSCPLDSTHSILNSSCNIAMLPGQSTFSAIDPKVGFGMIVQYDFNLPDQAPLTSQFQVPAGSPSTYVMRAYSGGVGDSEELQKLINGNYGSYSQTMWFSALAINIAHIVIDDNITTLLTSGNGPDTDKCAWGKIAGSGEITNLENQFSTQSFDTLSHAISSISTDVNQLSEEYIGAAKQCVKDEIVGGIWDIAVKVNPFSEAANTALEAIAMVGDAGQHLYELSRTASPVETAIVNVGPNPKTLRITGISPATLYGSSSTQTIRILGTGFAAGALVDYASNSSGKAGSAISTFVSRNEVDVSIGLEASDSSWSSQVQVVNPDGTTSNWWPFQVNASTAATPDLVPQGVSLSTTSVNPGGTVTVTFTVQNNGTAAAASSTTGFRLGTSNTIHPTNAADDVGWISTPPLAAGQSVAQSQTVTIPSSTAAGTYYLWVIVDNTVNSTLGQSNKTNDYASSPALTVSTAQTPVPTPISPGTSTDTGYQVNTTTPTMQWSGSGATTYELVISMSPYANANIVYDNKSIPGNSSSLIIPSGQLQVGVRYRWDMKATNSSGTSAWSSDLYFTVTAAVPAAPTLISPGSSASPGPTITTLTPTFAWNASSGATGYGLYVKDVGSGVLVYNNDAVGNITSLVLPSGTLVAGESYVWNMRASNSTGFSSYSTQYYFQEQGVAPATPTNLSPGSSSGPGPTTSSSAVTLSWSAPSGATSYEVAVRDIASGNLVEDSTINTTSFTTSHLSAGKQYRWDVDACNSAGCSSFALPLYFQTP